MSQTEQHVSSHELRDWLAAFQSDPLHALHHVPNVVYHHLRQRGLLTPDNRPANG